MSEIQPLQVNQFILSLFMWLIVTFTLWFYLNHWLIVPVIWLADPVLSMIVPETFSALTLEGNTARVFTPVGEVEGKLLPAKLAGHQLAFEFNTLTISYSLPFLTALLLAGLDNDLLKKLGLGLAVLYPFILLGVIFVALKQLMVGLGGYFTEAESVPALVREVIALGYQLSTIIIPTLLPVLIFVWLEKQQIAALIEVRRMSAGKGRD